MFDKILIPTDFSDEADLVLRFAIGLKSVGLKQVLLVHVMDVGRVSPPPIQEVSQGAIAEKIAERSKLLEDNGIGVQNEILEGKPDDEILRLSERKNISMIVTGSHGKTVIDEILKGSVSESLSRRSHVPVLVLHYDILKEENKKDTLYRDALNLFSRVLIPIDFTPVTSSLMDYTMTLKKAGIGEVLLLHVIDSKKIETNEEELEKVNNCQERMEDVRRSLEESRLSVKPICVIGDPMEKIITVANDEEATLIMLGTHGRGIMREWLQGSVSLRILRSAFKPALMVHE